MNKESIIRIATGLLLITLNSELSRAFAQGSLTPPGAPGPTMKTLAQIEPRTPISSAPFTISQPGSYYLTTNVTVSSGDAITIAIDNVTLDLNGFTISSTRPVATSDTAILLTASRRNIAIYNGHISSGVTNSAAGVFGGGGFANGIYYTSGYPPYNTRVKDVSVGGVLDGGIDLAPENSTVVESCTVLVAGSYGIYADSISDSTALNCGIEAIIASTAHNCYGTGVGSGQGLGAATADNCFGFSYGNGIGLEVGGTANNCWGQSSGSGYGLVATAANNCYGVSATGTGLFSSTANNCYGGSGGSGYGIYVYDVATGCYGHSSSGTGISAFLANVCHGVGSPAFSVTHNVNSF